MGTWKSPATNTLSITTIPIDELERWSLVLAKKGKKAQMMPMQVVKQALNAKRERIGGFLIRSR